MPKQIDKIAILLLTTAVFAAGCKDGRSESGPAKAREESKPHLVTMTIPAGTRVVAALETHLSSDTNHSGDPFIATTTAPIVIDGKSIAPTGTKIRGSLRSVQPSGRVKGRAQMTLAYEEIIDAAGNSYTITAQPMTLQAASDTHGDIEKIAAGGVLGAVIGGIAAGGKGAAIGAGAGAGAGTVLMLATKGDDVELNPGQKVSVHLTSATNMPVVARN